MSDIRAASTRLSTAEHPRRRWAATGISLAAVAGLTILDASWSQIISSTVVVAPFIAAMFAGVRQTALVAAASVLSALLSGIWNDNFADAGYVVRASVVVVGGVFSLLAARTRQAAERAETLGAQLIAALSNLTEAVVLQDRERRLVYARRLLPGGRHAADPGALPLAARAQRRGGATGQAPRHRSRDGRGALAAEQLTRRPRRPR